MTDLYFHSPSMFLAAQSMRATHHILEPVSSRACLPVSSALILGPRSPGLQAAAMLVERTEEAHSFIAAMTQYVDGLVTRFETTAAVFVQLENQI